MVLGDHIHVIMNYDELRAIILNESENVIYISDPITYELVYMNRYGLSILGVNNLTEVIGKKCYEFLQSKNAPCEFCTNNLLKKDSFYTWTHYNNNLDEYFIIQDKMIVLDEKELRLEIATNITKYEKKRKKLEFELSNEQTLVKCIQTLAEYNDIATAINKLLNIIADFYQGERAYIFEIDYGKQSISNTYEWCMEGISAEINNLQDIPICSVERWISEFKTKGEFYINSVGKTVTKESIEYEILTAQGIESLVVAPLIENNEIVGFLGVDNPSSNINDLTLLKSVIFFVMNDINKRQLLAKLEEMSFIDILTGLENRNKYISTLEEIEKNPPKTLGIIYMDLNGLKTMNDTHGHACGDKLLKHIAEILISIFKKDVFRIGGDEFVVFCRNVEKEKFELNVESLRKRIESDKELKVSIGSNWNTGKIMVDEQIAYADKLMYAEKKNYYRESGQMK